MGTRVKSRTRTLKDKGAIVGTVTCATDPNADTTQDPAQHYFPRPETWANGNISEYTAAATPPNPFTLPSGFQMIANPGGTATPFYIDDAGGIYAGASAGWIESTDPVNYSIQIGGNGYTGLYHFDQGSANAASTPALQEGETKWDTNPHDGRSGDPGSPNYEAPPPGATYPYLYAGIPIPTFSPSNGMSLIPLGGSNGAIMLGTTSQLNNDGTLTSGLGYANAGTINSLSDAVGFGGVNTLGEILYTSTVGGLKIANIQPGTASAIDPATGKPPTGIFPNGTLLNGIAGEWNSQHQIVNATQFWEKGTVYQTSDLIGTNSGWSGFYPSGMMGKVINDAGAIVGTATYSGTNTAIASGSHGVILLPVSVTGVSFDGTKYWQLESDDATTNYVAPQWTDTNGNYNASDPGEHNYATAYTCNTKPKIGATFKIPGASNWTNLKFKATGPDGISIPATAPSSISGDIVTMPVTESTTTLPNTIKYYNKADSTAFTLNWSVSVDGGTTWSVINSTKHTVYVTLADPVTSLRQESLFEIGCREANGISGSATNSGVKGTVTDAIFGDFISRNVKRVDGTQLTYYHSYTTTVTTTEDLLAGGDGQCGSWTSFFLDIRKAQGISDTNDYVLFQPTAGDGFIVNNWTFAATGNSGNTTYPYLNLPNLTSFIGTSSYNWLYAEVRDATGIPGQGTANPASLFNNHQMAYVNGQYYDPSYGIKHPTVADVQTSLAGFYIGPGSWPVNEPTVNLDLNGNGNKTDTGVSTTVILFTKTPATLNLTPTVSTY